MSHSTIKLKDNSTDEIIYEFQINEQEKAFSKARELEEMGIDVKISTPTSIETLGVALGADHQALEKVSCEINEELESHN